MKKQILLPMILLTITLLFTCSILYAVSYLAVKEEHEVQSENANFVFVNQNTTSKTMQITNTTSATVTIKNTSNISGKCDLLEVSSNGDFVGRKVNDTPIELSSNASLTIECTSLLETRSYLYVIAPITTASTNAYVTDAFDIEFLNQEYRHSVENEDSSIKLDDSIYSEVSSSIFNQIDFTNNPNYFYDHPYYLYENGQYVLARSYDSTKTYYQKQLIFKDSYQSNVMKDVYLLGKITIRQNMEINSPCNIHLLTNDIQLMASFGIHQYYSSLYSIDSYTGKIINNDFDVLISTPRGYCYTSTEEAISMNLNSTTSSWTSLFTDDSHVKKVASTDENYCQYVLQDAKKYIEAHFPTNYVEQDAQLRKEISYTTIFQKMNLPLDYYQMGVSFQYLQNGNAFVISRETANKNTSLTINITYDGETISTTKNLCIVGTSAESLLSSYAKELGYLLNRHEISPDNSIWIGGNEDKTSLYSKYYPYIHTPMAESNHDYV
jgi:hypothetical protein